MKQQLYNKMYESLGKPQFESLLFDDDDFEDDDMQLQKITAQSIARDEFDFLPKNWFNINDTEEIEQEEIDRYQDQIDLINKFPDKFTNKVVVNDLSSLKKLLVRTVKIFGNNGNYNWIDTFKVESLSALFSVKGLEDFNGDITLWRTGRVKNMNFTFAKLSSFVRDLSKWDVSNVTWAAGVCTGCNHDFAVAFIQKLSLEAKLRANFANI